MQNGCTHQVTAAVASMLEPAAKKARFGDAGQAAEPAVLVDVPPPAQGWCTAMQPARDARQLLDTTLIVGETRVEAHKLVLLSLSPYLNALFLSGFRESGADKGDVIVGDEHTNQHGYLTNACTGGGIQPRSTRCGVHPFTWL